MAKANTKSEFDILKLSNSLTLNIIDFKNYTFSFDSVFSTILSIQGSWGGLYVYLCKSVPVFLGNEANRSETRLAFQNLST